jgi:hypothetical protein
VPRTHFFGRDLNQFVGTRIADENGDLVIGRLAPVSGNELLDGFVSLPATLAVLGEKLIGDPANLKPAVASSLVDAIIDLLSEEPHFASERVTVNLREFHLICAPGVCWGSLSLRVRPADLRQFIATNLQSSIDSRTYATYIQGCDRKGASADTEATRAYTSRIRGPRRRGDQLDSSPGTRRDGDP